MNVAESHGCLGSYIYGQVHNSFTSRPPRHYISLSSRYFCDVFTVLTVCCISVAGGLTYRSYKWWLWCMHRMMSLQHVPWPCILDVHTLINKKCFNSWNFADLCGICTMYLKATRNGKDCIYEASSTYERIKKYLYEVNLRL